MGGKWMGTSEILWQWKSDASWAQVEKVIDALLGLEGDTKLSFDDLLILSKQA